MCLFRTTRWRPVREVHLVNTLALVTPHFERKKLQPAWTRTGPPSPLSFKRVSYFAAHSQSTSWTTTALLVSNFGTFALNHAANKSRDRNFQRRSRNVGKNGILPKNDVNFDLHKSRKKRGRRTMAASSSCTPSETLDWTESKFSVTNLFSTEAIRASTTQETKHG